ncbi:hypothetical protein [Sagittula marina]|uniref:hypothetical protein n=1 Tax=Sagittula marina TaxID=943940 RepID=UPI003CCD3044
MRENDIDASTIVEDGNQPSWRAVSLHLESVTTVPRRFGWANRLRERLGASLRVALVGHAAVGADPRSKTRAAASAAARLIRKVRSGVGLVQPPDTATALDLLSEKESTIINLQALNACVRDSWQLAHAAAVTDGARAHCRAPDPGTSRRNMT